MKVYGVEGIFFVCLRRTCEFKPLFKTSSDFTFKLYWNLLKNFIGQSGFYSTPKALASPTPVHNQWVMTLFNRQQLNNRSLQCCNSTHLHLLLTKHNNKSSSSSSERGRQCPRLADRGQQRPGLTTESGRLGRNLASLMASLWAWNILTLFMLDCQYLT